MKQPARTSTRQPLISRAMKVALMAEQSEIGNDEPWNRDFRSSISCQQPLSPNRKKMTISARPIAFFASCKVLRALNLRALKWVFVAAILAAAAAPDTADAARRAGIVRAGAYDGTWNVTFAPQAGNCHATNTVPFNVFGTRVSSAGGGKVTGGVSRGGIVSVRITVGASWANGSGRLVGNSGAGRWSGFITGDRCSGIWQASRS